MNKVKSNKHPQTVLITGAASGIGYELARIFARERYNLVLVDIKEKSLAEMSKYFQEKYNISIRNIVKDLSLTKSANEIFQELQQAGIKIDILANNAGFGSYGFFNETDINNELELLQVNVVCVTHLTKLLLKDMVKQGYGKILNVASAAAFQPGPLMAVYFASKAFVLSFSEAIANELKGTGVTVTALCPGATATPFHKQMGTENTPLVRDKNMMDAETVAKIGYRALMENKTVVITGLLNRILAGLVRFTPRNVVTDVVRSMQELQPQAKHFRDAINKQNLASISSQDA